MNQNHNISDQELDAMFHEASGSVGIPAFNDSFWNEMEAMLPKKKKRGFIFWLGSSAATLAVVFGVLFFAVPSNKTTVQANAARNLKSIDKSPTKSLVKQINTDRKTEIETIHQNNSSTGIKPIENSYRLNKKSGKPFDNKNENPSKIIDSGNKTNSDSELIETDRPAKEPMANLGEQSIRFTAPVTLNYIDNNKEIKSKHPFYVEFGIGYGQSYKQVDFENNWMSQYRVGGGIYTTARQMQMSVGLAFRAQVPNNISRVTSSTGYNNQNQPVDYKNETSFRGLYSLEFPLFIGGAWKRNVLGASMIPGVQLAYTGIQTNYENTQVVSRTKESGSVPNSKTMTMQVGLRYGYSISENVQLSATCNFDVIRPFDSGYYNGTSTNYPVSFFLGLRRTF